MRPLFVAFSFHVLLQELMQIASWKEESIHAQYTWTPGIVFIRHFILFNLGQVFKFSLGSSWICVCYLCIYIYDMREKMPTYMYIHVGIFYDFLLWKRLTCILMSFSTPHDDSVARSSESSLTSFLSLSNNCRCIETALAPVTSSSFPWTEGSYKVEGRDGSRPQMSWFLFLK